MQRTPSNLHQRLFKSKDLEEFFDLQIRDIKRKLLVANAGSAQMAISDSGQSLSVAHFESKLRDWLSLRELLRSYSDDHRIPELIRHRISDLGLLMVRSGQTHFGRINLAYLHAELQNLLREADSCRCDRQRALQWCTTSEVDATEALYEHTNG